MPENQCKILYVCQEIAPYLSESDISTLTRSLAQGMQERGHETRTFMPRYGTINERRNQLHEVIRLSGMNLIIDNNDHQLIIKVASIPSARIQVYFIDNDDYFQRKAIINDEQGEPFEDNDERALFFARGVLETVKKLRWSPNLVHVHGWFASLAPIYLKNTFSDDPLFQNTKVVVSLYNDGFDKPLDENFIEKVLGEGICENHTEFLKEPTYENLMSYVISYADGVILESETLPASLTKLLETTQKPVLAYQPKDTNEYMANYEAFYQTLLSND